MVTSIGADQFPIVIGTYVRTYTRARGKGESKIKFTPLAAEAKGRGGQEKEGRIPMGKREKK